MKSPAPTDPAAPSGASVPGVMNVRQAHVLTLALLLVSAFTIILAGPRFASAVVAAPHGDTLAAVGSAMPPSANAQARAMAAYSRALAWQDTSDSHAALGALTLAQAIQALRDGDAETAGKQSTRSAAEHRAALVASPLDPYVWTRFLQAELTRGADASDVMRALNLAIISAPWEPRLIIARLGLAFAIWGDLDDMSRRGLEPQIRHAAQFYPASLARQARMHRAQDQILQTLENDPDLLRRFSMAYSRS